VKAAVLADVGTLAVQERAEPTLGAEDEVLLAVEACGICGTDLHILSSPPSHPANVGVVLGHEFVGVAAEVGSAVRGVAAGDRVAVAPSARGAAAAFATSARTGRRTGSSSTAGWLHAWR
jgi:threonine dehydrogenase-like Zn-dependent dehydrogenase